MTTTRTRVLIADDHAVVRTGLRALLAADPASEVSLEHDRGVLPWSGAGSGTWTWC